VEAYGSYFRDGWSPRKRGGGDPEIKEGIKGRIGWQRARDDGGRAFVRFPQTYRETTATSKRVEDQPKCSPLSAKKKKITPREDRSWARIGKCREKKDPLSDRGGLPLKDKPGATGSMAKGLTREKVAARSNREAPFSMVLTKGEKRAREVRWRFAASFKSKRDTEREGFPFGRKGKKVGSPIQGKEKKSIQYAGKRAGGRSEN